MKHTIFIFVLSVYALVAGAKTTMSKPVTLSVTIPDDINTFRCTEVTVNDHSLSFSALPQNATAIYIMDSYGNAVSAGKLSRKNNTVNVKQLRPGLYTIVLKHKGTVKMFGYHTGVVVKGVRS